MSKRCRTQKRPKRRTGYVIALGFLIVIAIGTLLLCLPVSSAEGKFTPPLDALFTTVSATCVTGLSVTVTAAHWSGFGQVVILMLIQVGGLGFMTMAVLLSVLLRRAVTPRERMLVAMSYNLNDYNSIMTLVRRILVGTAVIEGTGAIALATRFVPDFGWGRGIWYSVFHSVSAFCNAGFDLLGDSSVAPYVRDVTVNVTLMLLILLGGIGFLVWSDGMNVLRDLTDRRRETHRRFSVYSRLVLLISGILLVSGAVLFALMEWNNPETIGTLSFGEKIMASFFHSVTLRTAGFSNFSHGAMYDGTKVLSMLYMFVGGASGSTAGGVKVVTVGVLLWTVISVAAGRKNTVVFGRKISQDACIRAVAVITFQLFLVFLGALILTAAEPELGIVPILYEVVSAVSTVGLSVGITGGLGAIAKVVLILLMYFGRVGILTVTLAVLENLGKQDSGLEYPEANLLIG